MDATESEIDSLRALIGASRSIAEIVAKLGEPSETILSDAPGVAWKAQHTFVSGLQHVDIVVTEAPDGTCEILARPRHHFLQDFLCGPDLGGILKYGR